MANQFSKTQMAALWDEVAETTSINMTLSKDLDMYHMEDLSDMGRTATGESNPDSLGGSTDSAQQNGGQDQEWIPQSYRFEPKDGIVSSDSDFENLIDRMIPVQRARAKRILARISTKDLRDPMRRKKKMEGMARDLANTVDVACYNEMLNQASRVITSNAAFSYQTAIAAEMNLQSRGYSAFQRKLFLSIKHYGAVAASLGQNQYNGPNDYPADALTKARIPELATFDTMRSDYLINVAPPTTTSGITVMGANQNHTVATYTSAGFFQDNRSQTLTIAGVTDAANFPRGTKFTIAGVNALHEETREDTGELQTFTVIAQSATTPTIQPAIVTSGPYRNCSAAPAAAAAITVLNTSADAPSLFYTPESTVLIPGRLPVPADAGGVEILEASTEQGLPMRFSYWYDPHNEIFNCKALVYFDVQVIYPEQLGAIFANQSASNP